MKRFDEIILLVSQYFIDNKIPFTIIGGVAILFQGRFRTTEDIDFLIIHDNMDIIDFSNFCRKNELSVDKFELQEGFKDGTHISIMDFPSRIRIDLKSATTQWDNGAINEADTFSYENVCLKVAKPEYLIVNKLLKGSKIDLEDAYSVFYQNEKRIDKTLLKHLSKLLNVEEKLHDFLKKEID